MNVFSERALRALSVSLVALASSGFVLSCARAPLRDSQSAMRISEVVPTYQDDRSFQGLEAQLKTHAQLLERMNNEVLRFGPYEIAAKDYARALFATLEVVRRSGEQRDHLAVSQHLKEKYLPLEVYGSRRWGDVLVTGYYDPIVSGRRTPDAKHYRPVFGVPDDMVSVDLGAFAEVSTRWSPLLETSTEQKSESPLVRGRLVRRGGQTRLLPYWSRREIDELGLLFGRAPILAYVDPVDAFFMQIQGSATIDLVEGERLRVGYASQNGYPYFAVGKALSEEIPKEKMSMQAIAEALRRRHPALAQKVMNQNASYVFFTPLKGEPRTTLGTEVVAGRTIATDRSLFPKGALAWLEVPLKDGDPAVGRLVMDQDTGGAIRGPGRVDWFLGQGPEAEIAAGSMKQRGRLVYLFPRPEWIQELGSRAGPRP